MKPLGSFVEGWIVVGILVGIDGRHLPVAVNGLFG